VHVIDANVALYAINRRAPNHEPARCWLDGAFAGRATVAFAWIVMLAVLRRDEVYLTRRQRQSAMRSGDCRGLDP
jgi:predicted nucleic acid-binding protein